MLYVIIKNFQIEESYITLDNIYLITYLINCLGYC